MECRGDRVCDGRGEVVREFQSGDEIEQSEEFGCKPRLLQQQAAMLEDGATSASLGAAEDLV